ncbi:MAG TPA: hypothetical protein VHA80_06610 [Solirubrobacterales bacterium]|nr:hypothetical protein [Solirubrobacterales bacterium]
MPLSPEDERRVEAEVAGMVADLRLRPSQEKEDRVGLEIAVMPEEERAFVPTVLLRFVAAERRGEPLPDPLPFSGPAPRRSGNRFGWTLRFPRAAGRD